MFAGAGLGALAGFETDFNQRGEDAESFKLMQQRYHANDDDTSIAATFSSWLYVAEESTVQIANTHGGPKAAYYDPEETNWEREDIKGYIPNGTILVKVRECEDKWGQPCLVLRWLDAGGILVCVKTKNTKEISQVRDGPKFDVIGSIKEFFKARGASTRITESLLRAKLFKSDALSPSLATLIVKGEDDQLTMFVGWQGTMVDQRPLDLFTDLAAAPTRCFAWYDEYPLLSVHAGILAKVQADALDYKQDLMDVLSEYEVKRLIFTGHSLGGGCAIIAHMFALSTFSAVPQDGGEERLQDIAVQSITFAAPMVWYVPSTVPHDERLDSLKESFSAMSTNYVCGNDVVPRLPGLPEYYIPAFKDVMRGLVNQAASDILGVGDGHITSKLESLAAYFSDSLLTTQGNTKTFKAMSNYFHMSTIMHLERDGNITELNNDEFRDRCNKFEPRDGENHMYLAACHSFFPRCVI